MGTRHLETIIIYRNKWNGTSTSAARDGTHLCRIFRACMAYGFIPIGWRQVKVTFIPKSGKLDYTKANAYHSISLLSFLLKRMEEVVDRHIRNGVLKNCPLN
jgi:hypothetical protein